MSISHSIRALQLLALVALLASLLSPAFEGQAESPILSIENTAVINVSYLGGLPIHSGLVGTSLEVPTTHYLATGSKGQANMAASSSVRGPSGGLFSQIYDWRDPLGQADDRRTDTAGFQWTSVLSTLNFLRMSRDHANQPVIVVNSNGISERYSWPVKRSDNPYITKDTAEMAKLAADWLFYTNFVVQTFDRSQPPDPASQDEQEAQSAVLIAALHWFNVNGDGVQATLPLAGESVPSVRHWEIGNEPNFNIGGLSSDPEEFAARYAEIADALAATQSAIDPNVAIELGPALMNLQSPDPYATSAYVKAILATGAQLDFVAYHPYTLLFGPWYSDDNHFHTVGFPDFARDFGATELALLRSNLNNIYVEQAGYANEIRQDLPAEISLSASEWNPSRSESSFHLLWRTKSVANSLAVMETLFSFARLEIGPAHYQTNPAVENDTATPLYATFRYLRENLRGRLLASLDSVAGQPVNFRVYVSTGKANAAGHEPVRIWVLNWDEIPHQFEINLSDLPTDYLPAQRCSLIGPSLLHGSLQDSGRPSSPELDQAIQVGCSPAIQPLGSPKSAGTSRQLNIEAAANGWTVYTLNPILHQVESHIKPGAPGLIFPGDVVQRELSVANLGNVDETLHFAVSGNS